MNFDFVRIFSDVSLTKEQVRRYLPGAQFCGAAQSGDLIKAFREQVRVAAIIDGPFGMGRAMTQAEISDALGAGMVVFGSSGIGALRAIELRFYGMIGYGSVYDYILNQEHFRDELLRPVVADRLQGTTRSICHTRLDLLINLESLMKKRKITRTEINILMEVLETVENQSELYTAACQALRRTGRTTRAAESLKFASENMNCQSSRDAVGLLKSIKAYIQDVAKINSLILKASRSSLGRRS